MRNLGITILLALFLVSFRLSGNNISVDTTCGSLSAGSESEPAASGQEIIDDHDKKYMAFLKRKLKADSIIFDTVNEDCVFMIRKKRSGKWGIMQSADRSNYTLVPCSYDSVQSPPSNAEFVFVYNGSKMGIYLLEWTVGSKDAKESVTCIYDELVKTEIKGCTYLAGYKAGKWMWIDWYTGREVEEGTFNSFNDLPKPDCRWESEFYKGTGGCPGCLRLRSALP